jgi:UDP-N-acetylglucosamine 2-epimerase
MSILLQDLESHSLVNLKIIVTDSHFSEEFCSTYREIGEDGFTTYKKIAGALDSRSATALEKTVGTWTGQYAEALEGINPDLVLVMGDRKEALMI